LLVLVLRPLLRGIPVAVDALFAGAPQAELAMVMIVCPLCMNLAQAWIQDAALKASAHHGGGMIGGLLSGDGLGSPLHAHGRSAFSKARSSSFGGTELEAVWEARASQEGIGCDTDGGESCAGGDAAERGGRGSESDTAPMLLSSGARSASAGELRSGGGSGGGYRGDS
jgi:hypothetical protein